MLLVQPWRKGSKGGSTLPSHVLKPGAEKGLGSNLKKPVKKLASERAF